MFEKLLTLRLHCLNYIATVCRTGDEEQGMVNSMLIGMEYQQMLPTSRIQYTEGYEGFFHLDHFNGDVETSMMKYLIRDHDMEKFGKRKKEQMRQIAAFLNQKYRCDGTVEIKMQGFLFQHEREDQTAYAAD